MVVFRLSATNIGEIHRVQNDDNPMNSEK